MTEKLILDPAKMPPDGALLADYDDESRRRYAVALMRQYLPSKVGDAKFQEITQGRAEAAKKTKSFFSTCGELAMFLLERLGYVGPMLNRSLPGDGANYKSIDYRYGMNMSYIRYRSEREQAWVSFEGDNFPKTGDILFVSNGPPSTEHVCILKNIVGTTWNTFDAGQYKSDKLEQEAHECNRTLTDMLLGTRRLHGWVDITKLKLVRPAFLAPIPLPERPKNVA
jgi:hypothetical protein